MTDVERIEHMTIRKKEKEREKSEDEEGMGGGKGKRGNWNITAENMRGALEFLICEFSNTMPRNLKILEDY